MLKIAQQWEFPLQSVQMSEDLQLPLDVEVNFACGKRQIPCVLTRMTAPGLKASPEYLEALIQLYHSVLPNVSLEQLQSSLGPSDLVHYMLFRKEEAVRDDYHRRPARLLRRYRNKSVSKAGTLNIEEYSAETDPDSDDGADLLVKTEDFIRSKKKTQFEKNVRQALPGLIPMLTQTKKDIELIDPQSVPVRPKDMLLGACTLCQRQLETFPPSKVCQLLYIGVRVRFQLIRIGRRLLQTAIALEGKASDAFFTLAGPDSLRFFRNGGLSDDPLLAGRFQQLNEGWADAVPMVLVMHENAAGRPMLSAEEKWERYRAEAYQRYAAESYFVRQLLEENQLLQKRVVALEKVSETFDQQVALERSRCVMYEQLVQSLEAQLLAAGIKPRVDQDEIIQKVISNATKNTEPVQ